MRKLLLTLAVLGALVALGWHFTRPQPVAVRVATVERGEVRATVSNTRVGTVEACRRTRMSPAAAGQVAVLLVAEGDKVEGGTPLLEIWNQDRKAELRLAETEVVTARLRAEEACAITAGAARVAHRLARLRKNQLLSEEIADDAATRSASAKAACEAALAATRVAAARIAVAREAVERTVLRAPFAGVVAEVNAKLGEFLTPSPSGIATMPAIDLIDPSCIYISAPIDEVDAPRIRAGMPACVSLDAFPDRYCDASVRRVAPYVLEREKQARTVEVEVALAPGSDDGRVLPGYSADIEVLLEVRAGVLRVPTEAVIEGDRVLRFDPAAGTLATTPITTGLSNWSHTEITDGLAEGDLVVISTGREGVVDGAEAVVEDASTTRD